MEEQNPNNQLQIELKEDVAQGTYANLVMKYLLLSHDKEAE